jgi:hypothetical protein
MPESDWFAFNQSHGCRSLPEDFRYSSETCEFASLSDIRALIDRVVGADQQALAQALTPAPAPALAPMLAPAPALAL